MITEDIITDWEEFLAPYSQAVEELKLKLRNMRQEFQAKGLHSPIEFVTGRVKTKESIISKMNERKIPADELLEGVQDIAGIRVMCQFVEDIYEVVDLIMSRHDIKVLYIRDYIKDRKDSGYRSYHIVLEYPVQGVFQTHRVVCEIQIRTLAMNFWATIEHSLNYKYKGQYPSNILLRLERAAEAAFMLDEEMSEIRDEIQEAHRLFDYGRDRHSS